MHWALVSQTRTMRSVRTVLTATDVPLDDKSRAAHLMARDPRLLRSGHQGPYHLNVSDDINMRKHFRHDLANNMQVLYNSYGEEIRQQDAVLADQDHISFADLPVAVNLVRPLAQVPLQPRHKKVKVAPQHPPDNGMPQRADRNLNLLSVAPSPRPHLPKIRCPCSGCAASDLIDAHRPENN